MDFTTAILRYLRDQYETAVGEKMIYDNNMQSSQAVYYFKDLKDNLIEPMSEETTAAYKSGDGNELEEKMRAIRSSSAMTYNLLGNGIAKVKADSSLFIPGNYKITYEMQLDTIKHNPRKANLDAFLEGKNQLIFCEMKMTEWLFNRPGRLRESYLQRERYIHPEIFDAAMKCLDVIILQNPTDYKTYYSALEQYDALQMFKHMIAVYNFAADNKGSIPKNIRLINCVWHLPKNAAVSEDMQAKYQVKEKQEHAEFDIFYASAKGMRDCFAALDIDFDIIFVTAAEFANQFSKTSEQKKYLTRYFA